MNTGTIKFVRLDHGFAFVCPTNGGVDVYVPRAELERAGIERLQRGTRVSFDTKPDRYGKGPIAFAVKLLDADAA